VPRIQAALVLGGLLLVTATCSSSSIGPSSVVTVAGQLQLNHPGQTSQLTATVNGSDETSRATWLSTDTTVVSVSSTGLMTAIGFGSAAINVSFEGAIGRAGVSVAAVTTIGCQQISFPGAYTVTADQTQIAGSDTCIRIISTSNVQLDCQSHNVINMLIANSTDVSVTHCVFPFGVIGANLTRVTLDHDTIPADGVSLTDSSAGVMTNNTVAGGTYVVALTGGHNNQISGNTLEGHYDGSGGQVGSDDGVLLVDEMNDTVSNNTISDVYDAGIEGANTLGNTAITNNTITNAAAAGIASYYCTSWSNNTVSGNTVSTSASVMWVLYETSGTLCGTTEAPANFTNNQISANQLHNPLPTPSNTGLNINLRLFPMAVSNNVVQGNILGSQIAMNLDPIAGFIDGGGNQCLPNTGFCGGGLASGRTKSLEANRSAFWWWPSPGARKRP
jgi:parallel beta-helix repeat protein